MNLLGIYLSQHPMVLYLIGLGLRDEKDITVRGLEICKKCKHVYLEYYTSILGVDAQALQSYYGIPIKVADREMVTKKNIFLSHIASSFFRLNLMQKRYSQVLS
jgi:diphthamide biosynthesis methyltransferase